MNPPASTPAPAPEVPAAAACDQHLIRPGNTNCGGCGMSIALHMMGRAVGDTPVRMVIPACCAIVTVGAFPASAYGVPVVSSTFASTAAVATGLARVAALNDDPTRIICWAGDGGTYDIGMATISAAAERGEDLLYVCYDNEIYGNTGGQRSSATPVGASTTTTPFGKTVEKKDILSIMAAHGIEYTASVSLAHLDDAMRKMRHALDLPGFRFLHILAPCPTGWKSEPSDGVELIRDAVASGLYPVYEVDAEGRLTIDVDPPMDDAALKHYFESQGRFRKVEPDLADIRRRIDRHWKDLRRRAAPT